MTSFNAKASQQILEKNLSKLKCDVHISAFMCLYTEIVKYIMQSSKNVDDAQDKLSALGAPIGRQMLDLIFLRDRTQKREIRLRYFLFFIKSKFWLSVFGKEADELERDGSDEHIYYMIEREPLLNKFTRYTFDPAESERKARPLNLAALGCGVLESALTSAGFPCHVTLTWHKGTTYVIKFEDSVIVRLEQLEARRI